MWANGAEDQVWSPYWSKKGGFLWWSLGIWVEEISSALTPLRKVGLTTLHSLNSSNKKPEAWPEASKAWSTQQIKILFFLFHSICKFLNMNFPASKPWELNFLSNKIFTEGRVGKACMQPASSWDWVPFLACCLPGTVTPRCGQPGVGLDAAAQWSLPEAQITKPNDYWGFPCLFQGLQKWSGGKIDKRSIFYFGKQNIFIFPNYHVIPSPCLGIVSLLRNRRNSLSRLGHTKSLTSFLLPLSSYLLFSPLLALWGKPLPHW